MAYTQQLNNNNTGSNLPTTSSINVRSTDTLRLNEQEVSFKFIDKTFGRSEDYLELHVYNTNDELIESKTNFKEYTLVGSAPSNEIDINPSDVACLKLQLAKTKVVKLLKADEVEV